MDREVEERIMSVIIDNNNSNNNNIRNISLNNYLTSYVDELLKR